MECLVKFLLSTSTRTLFPIPFPTSPFPALGVRSMLYAKAELISILWCSAKREAVLEGGASMKFRCRTGLGSNSGSSHWQHNWVKRFLSLAFNLFLWEITCTLLSYCADSASWYIQCSLAPWCSHSRASTNVSIRSFLQPTKANLRTTGLSPTQCSWFPLPLLF